jgi:hypothetical protein
MGTGSLGGIDKVHAVDSARIEAALKSAAVIQSVEEPVADEDERQHRKEHDDIDESPAFEIVFPLPSRRRVQAMKLEFARSIFRQLSSPLSGIGAALSIGSLAHLYAVGQFFV